MSASDALVELVTSPMMITDRSQPPSSRLNRALRDLRICCSSSHLVAVGPALTLSGHSSIVCAFRTVPFRKPPSTSYRCLSGSKTLEHPNLHSYRVDDCRNEVPHPASSPSLHLRFYRSFSFHLDRVVHIVDGRLPFRFQHHSNGRRTFVFPLLPFLPVSNLV